jgi:hypothetical protein
VIGSLAFGHPQRAREHVGFEPTIRIGKENPIARSRAGANVAGVTLAQPAVWQRVQALQLNARILPRETVENFSGAIAGSVIYDNDLDLHPPLREQMTNRLLDPGLFIPSRNDDRTSALTCRR